MKTNNYNYKTWQPDSGDVRVPALQHIHIIKHVQTLVRNLTISIPVNCEKILNILADNEILEYEIKDDEKLPNADGITNKTNITFRSSVIHAIGDEKHYSHNRHRFTVCHELGHVFLHHSINYGHARAIPPSAAYESAEAQANAFAGFLLVPFESAKSMNFNEDLIVERCRVSRQVASIAIKNYRRLMNKSLI